MLTALIRCSDNRSLYKLYKKIINLVCLKEFKTWPRGEHNILD